MMERHMWAGVLLESVDGKLGRPQRASMLLWANGHLRYLISTYSDWGRL